MVRQTGVDPEKPVEEQGNIFYKRAMAELDEMELRKVNGALIWKAITVLGVISYVYNNWGDFTDGIKEGFESVRNGK